MFYRIRSAVNRAYYAHRTRHIRQTAPIPCDPLASCEVHTMLSAHDVPMYLVAVKSLLRCYPSVSVVVLSDGTLDERHERAVHQHVPGSSVVRAEDADSRAREILGEGSFAWELRGFDPSYRRIVDTELWGNTERRIIMDADILVLRQPVEVIDWIERGTSPFLMGQPPRPVAGSADGDNIEKKHIQSIFKEKLDVIGSALDESSHFLDGTTGGFYGCMGGLTLDRIEKLVGTCLQLGIPMNMWGGEQCAVIYLLSVAGATRLDSERYMNFGPDCIDKANDASLLHFYGTHRFLGNVYPDLSARVVTELLQGHHAVAN